MIPHADHTPKPGSGAQADQDVERDLARVLTALRSAQPPDHIESRVLARLKQREPAASRGARWAIPRHAPARVRSWALGLCVATAIVAAVAVSIHKPAGPPAGAVANATRAEITGTAPGADAELSSAANSLSVIGTGKIGAGKIGAGKIGGSRGEPTRGHRLTSTTEVVVSRRDAEARNPDSGRHPRQILCDCDPTAVAEANAPSLPPPPLPLTEQEKLLLRIAQHLDPVEVAELDPGQREAAIAREQAEYKRFFHPTVQPPVPDVRPAPTLSSAQQSQPQTQPQNSTAELSGDHP